MTSPLENRIEQAMAEFERHKASVADFEARVADSRTTVTTKNRALSVTVNAQGELVEVKFPTGAYRTMAPAELAGLLVDAVRDAQLQARQQAAQLLQALLPAGVPVLDMLTGPVDFDATMDEITRVFAEARQPRETRTAGGERRP
ncbi:YbaB/EbfC family nucleoid-associated protein [Micromonospora sp. NPDC049559]|uniref:YbaB/EbfC family nucleoid-associated protein n=1 Tax=Micromonospora sp. NPDC049559 TaxID=3155923 RepID=UPI0034352EE2